MIIDVFLIYLYSLLNVQPISIKLTSGISTGIIASVIGLITELLSDLRIGFCQRNILLTQERCCSSTAISNPLNQWNSWHHFFQSQKISWVLFALSSLVFATLATLIVHLYPSSSFEGYKVYHTSGSGVPQVKVILGGFVIRGFLGFRTLLIKFLALVNNQ